MSLKITEEMDGTLQLALDTWGIEEQFGMANEEFAEAITAINQFKRCRIDDVKLASEIADAFIMASQIAKFIGYGKVQDQINYKMNRLKGRIDNYQSGAGTGV